jgi:hypothetical protein
MRPASGQGSQLGGQYQECVRGNPDGDGFEIRCQKSLFKFRDRQILLRRTDAGLGLGPVVQAQANFLQSLTLS